MDIKDRMKFGPTIPTNALAGTTENHTPQQQQPTRQAGRSNNKPLYTKAAIVLAGLVFVAAIGSAVFFYGKYNSVKNTSGDQASTGLITEVGKLLDLPKGETPTVATVQDKNKLSSQPFFASAQNGDKLLIYTKAKKAIIYRPGEKRVINVGPIALDGSNTTTTGTAPAVTPAKQ